MNKMDKLFKSKEFRMSYLIFLAMEEVYGGIMVDGFQVVKKGGWNEVSFKFKKVRTPKKASRDGNI